MKLRLKAKTKKGKDRLSFWGKEWMLIEEHRGRLLIRAVMDKDEALPESSRWIDKVDDPDFSFEEIKNEDSTIHSKDGTSG